MNILPTENSKYKIFVISAQENNEIKEANNIDLFMYIRLFLTKASDMHASASSRTGQA